MRAAVGDNRLMPKPELECLLINADSGYARTNHSWILSRMIRDFEYWRGPICDQEKVEKLKSLRDDNERKRRALEAEKRNAGSNGEKEALDNKLKQLPSTNLMRIGLRITVWECVDICAQGSGDWIYWIGILVSAVQLGISAVPWGLYGEWYTFLVTASGTLLAYVSAALPQWTDEKTGVRALTKDKRILLTEGNGSDEIILLLCHPGNRDLEALASPRRDLRNPQATRVFSFILALLWVGFLITVAGWEEHTWFLVGVGMIGILHNVVVAGTARRTAAWGIHLRHERTIAEGKVMQTLHRAEELYPMVGSSLVSEFFPGDLSSREGKVWSYAKRRSKAWNLADRLPGALWSMPPLIQAVDSGRTDVIPEDGEYQPVVDP